MQKKIYIYIHIIKYKIENQSQNNDQEKKLRDNLLNENDKETLNLTFSLVVNISTGEVPFLPALDRQLWEITCLSNGSQATKRLMVQFTKFVKDIQEDRSKKRIIRGSRKHVIKKIKGYKRRCGREANWKI